MNSTNTLLDLLFYFKGIMKRKYQLTQISASLCAKIGLVYSLLTKKAIQSKGNLTWAFKHRETVVAVGAHTILFETYFKVPPWDTDSVG